MIDICAKFADPLKACRAVMAKSYKLWLQYELQTDDITMICIFINDVNHTKALKTLAALMDIDRKELEVLARGEEEESANEKDDDLVESSTRPVRTNMSLQKSRALSKSKIMIRDVTNVEEEDFNAESLYGEKTEEDKRRIDEAIRAHLIFHNITEKQRELIHKAMELMKVSKGQWIVQQGMHGDCFYVVDERSFEVRILAENQVDEDGTRGDCVHVYEGSRIGLLLLYM